MVYITLHLSYVGKRNYCSITVIDRICNLILCTHVHCTSTLRRTSIDIKLSTLGIINKQALEYTVYIYTHVHVQSH